MKRPEPQPGLVIRYDYLWHRESSHGQIEGKKFRPCAIVVARKTADNGDVVLVAPITHSPPMIPQNAIEIPQLVKQHLGLDSQRSWIVTSEINAVSWTDPGIVPATKEKWAYGFLPRGMVAALTENLLERFRKRKVVMVDRGGVPKMKS